MRYFDKKTILTLSFPALTYYNEFINSRLQILTEIFKHLLNLQFQKLWERKTKFPKAD